MTEGPAKVLKCLIQVAEFLCSPWDFISLKCMNAKGIKVLSKLQDLKLTRREPEKRISGSFMDYVLGVEKRLRVAPC